MGVFNFIQGPREKNGGGVEHGETTIQFAIDRVVLQRLTVVLALARVLSCHATREVTIHLGTT